jgi:hypothetical protein
METAHGNSQIGEEGLGLTRGKMARFSAIEAGTETTQ